MEKRKWKSKTFALLMAIMMVFTMMPQIAFADGQTMMPQEAGSVSREGTIIISNAAELAALGGQEINGTVELAADIDMSDVAMEPIEILNGAFEGNGYTISNLTLNSAVKLDTYTNATGLIAKLEGEVRNLKLEKVHIELESGSWTSAGTIAGIVEAAQAGIRNCSVRGTLKMPSSASSVYAGGILGSIAGNANTKANVAIENCVSDVAVSSGSYPGGIIGHAYTPYASLTLKHCAVLGDVEITSSNGYGAGIIGWLYNAPVRTDSVYFGGKISGGRNYGFAYNKNSSGTITANAVYYDNTKNRSGSTWDPFELYTTSKLTGSIAGKSTADLKALQLDGFTKRADFDGYPVPSWLETSSASKHMITVTTDGADKITLTKDGSTTEMTGSGNGVFTAALEEGRYAYTAETSRGDKDDAFGTLIVGKADKSMMITLPNKVADTVITVEGPADASLAVYKGNDANGTLIQAKTAENGVYTYALKEGSYYYEAAAEEYETASGTFIIPVSDSKLTVTMTASPKYNVTFDVKSGEKTPSVKVFRGEKTYQPQEGSSMVYALCNGTYSYEVTAEDYISKTGSFTVKDAAQTVSATLESVSGTGSKETPYIISSKETLVYFAQQVNSGVKKYVEGYVRLSADIDLENMSWTPIGTSRSTPFRGHFDGAGHTISGLNVTTARTYYGFFGCLDNAVVENLTLKGQVYCAEPYARVGGLAGYAVGDVTIRNCGSAVNVSALARGCEGVGGLIGGYEDGIEYKWEDHKLAIENSYNAGNIVCTGSDTSTTIGGLVGGNKNCVQLENCYNVGAVYGPGVQSAGLLGNAGSQTGDNCKPSMKGCYNAGQVVGADGKAFDLYGKGNISSANMKDCYAETGSASGTNPGTNLVSNETERKAMLDKLGSGWTIDPDENNGLPYLTGTNPVAADTTLLDELGKYADTIAVSADAAVGTILQGLKDGETDDKDITASITQSKDDIQKGCLTAAGNTLKLAKKNETGAAITETATLTLSKGVLTISKPISVVIYPAADQMASLLDTIAATYVGKSDEWVIFDMTAYAQLNGKTSKTQETAKQNYKNLTINALAQNSALASDRAKGELILGTLGVDTKSLTPYNGQAYNNAAKLQAMSMNVSYYTAPWILLADEQGNVGLTSAQVQQLVKILTDSQGTNGLCQGAYWGKTYDDIDTTGTALAALARFAKAAEDPYGAKAEAETFVAKALTGLAKAQGGNGSFGNVNTDAMVITGLAAIGTNPKEFKKNGSSLADALSLYVNAGQNGFNSAYADGETGEKAQALATEQGFRALVVLEKMNSGAASYNIYTGKTGAAAENPKPGSNQDRKPGSATGEGETGETPSTPGKPGSGESGSKNMNVSLTICPDGKTQWLASSYTLTEGATAYDLIIKAMAASGMSCVGAEKNYITSVTKGTETLAASDKGPNSGWMYTVNDGLPNVGIQDYKLKAGDAVKLYYVEDYTKDSGTGSWTPASPGKDEQKPADPSKDDQQTDGQKETFAKVRSLTAKLSLKARSVKTAKSNVKVSLQMDAETKSAVKEMQDMGYTVKYRFYRSTKKTVKYQPKATKKAGTYTNTTGRKGTKYFYKAQVCVYDKDGNPIAKTTLKQCRYACRNWSK